LCRTRQVDAVASVVSHVRLHFVAVADCFEYCHRFRGVKKKIVAVAKSVETLMEGDGSEQLLYPSDLRPLAAEERQAIVLMSSFCPQQSTPDPGVGTALAQGTWAC
jgi:hypothetical protein